jgi:UDPglucose 6-dehydrogenase
MAFKNLGIAGLGTVGGALLAHFEQQGIKPWLYDPGKNLGSVQDINQAEVVFICVPTPFSEQQGCDLSAVAAVIKQLVGSKIVVIKSTVIPGTTENFQQQYPQHKFLMNPEFLREISAVQDMLQPERQLVGYTAQSQVLANEILALLPRAPLERTMPASAVELVKYFGNVFLATKVMLANEMYDLCALLKIDYPTVAEAVAGDSRIGASHLQINPQARGYGGKCFPKDVAALAYLMRQLHSGALVVPAVDEHNRLYQDGGK